MKNFHYGMQLRLYQDEKFFGSGVATLLTLIEQTGSVSAAAKQMRIAYSKTYKMLKTAEQNLGFALIETQVGGKNGGSAKLTSQGMAFLIKYRLFFERVNAFAQVEFDKLF